MRKQLNFLNSIPKEPIQLPARLIGLSLLGLTIILFLIFISLVIQRIYYVFELKQTNANYLEIVKEFQKTAYANPLLSGNIPLEKQVGDLEQTLQLKKATYEMISHSSLRRGFSVYLDAFAKMTLGSIWLSGIDINQVDGRVKIQGFLLKPADISLLITGLQLSGLFPRMTFDMVSIIPLEETKITEDSTAENQAKKNKTYKPYLSFTISNKPIDKTPNSPEPTSTTNTT